MLAVEVLSKNHVQVTGRGPAMVFVHGFGCDQTMWDRLSPNFEEDHQVVRYDLTGMGRSDHRNYDRVRHGDLQGHADDLIEILEALEVAEVTAVGHSVSAVIVALAAIRRPDLFATLVMVGPSPCYIDKPPYRGGFSEEDIQGLLQMMEENHTGWAGQLASLVAGQEQQEVEKELDERFCRNDPEISRHFARVTFLSDNRADLPKVRTPTLVIQSAKDVIAEPAVGRYVHEQIKGSELVLVETTGHAPHMTHPDQVAQAIRKFLDKQRSKS